jgi:hypothetical protein
LEPDAAAPEKDKKRFQNQRGSTTFAPDLKTKKWLQTEPLP